MQATSKRPFCAACQRPPATCFCALICQTPNAVELLILQHPLEVAQTKGTARLLHACLHQCRLAVGETFAPKLLMDWLHGGAPPRNTVLLYPPTPEPAALGIATAPELNPDWLNAPVQLRLVVLDGTWRKSRKMLYLNPALQALPRLALSPVPESRYQIRKAQRAGQLSTLEAACAALAQLENNTEKYAPLLSAFDTFVQQQT